MLTIALALALAAPPEPFALGPLRARWTLPPETVPAHAPFTLRLTVSGPKDVLVGTPNWKPDMAFPNAKLLEVRPEGPDTLGGPTAIWLTRSWAFVFEPLGPGRIALPALELPVNAGGKAGEEIERAEAPAFEAVAAGSPAPAGNTLKQGLIVGGTLLLALALAGVFAKRQPLGEPPPPAEPPVT